MEPTELRDAVAAARPDEVVVVPPGVHACAPLRLKSQMTLRLEAGATLKASRDIGDYPMYSELHRECAIGCAFIGGANLERVTIEGGVFDASGDAFWSDYDGAPSPEPSAFRPRIYQAAPRRPTAMLFVNCRDLTLRDFTILNSPSYTIWLIGCERVRIENVRIRNHRLGPNTDGLDIDCSRDVFVRGCDLACGDDCIALKSDVDILGEERACERIVISDCILTTPCCGIRVGYEGDGVIRDVVASNLVIHDSNKGLDFLSLIPRGRRFGIRRGARMEDLLFSNIVMRGVRQAIHVWSNVEEPERAAEYRGWIRRVQFRGMCIEALDASFIGGLAVSEITLRDIRMRVRRDMARYRGQSPVGMPTVWGIGYLEKPLTIFHADDTVLEAVEVTGERFNEE